MFDLYIEYEFWFAAIQLALAMLGMGATLTVADFGEVLKEPKAFTTGMVLQMIIVPLLAGLFLYAVGLMSGLMVTGVLVGIALCAAIPGGALSNIFTHLGRGNIALSIAITAVSTLFCMVTSALVLELLIAQYMPPNFTLPTVVMARDIFFCLLLPLLTGMVFLRLFPGLAARFSVLCIRGSLWVIMLIIIGSLGAGRLDFIAFGLSNAMLVLAFIVMLTLAGWGLPRLMRLAAADCHAINVEVTVRNTNLALLIKASLFPAVVGAIDPIGDTVLFTILLYASLMLVISGGLIYLRRLQFADPGKHVAL